MNNYQEKAQVTSAPVTPELVARLKSQNSITELGRLLAKMTSLGDYVDLLKRHIFYNQNIEFSSHVKEDPIGNANDIAEKIKTEAHVKVIHGIIGKITEAGEMASALLGWLYLGEDLDAENLIEEVGDGFWYDAELLTGIGTTMDKAMQANIAKLAKRYEQRFSDSAALNRDVEKERHAMKGTFTGGEPQ